MNRRTLEALQGSIAKWIAIANGTLRDEGAKNCPLCELYNNWDNEPQCSGCPVSEASGSDGCQNTPYTSEWYAHGGGRGKFADSPALTRAALSEVAFLTSLLPAYELCDEDEP